jgi:hypothetical protein
MSLSFGGSKSKSQSTTETFIDPNQQAALDFSRQLGQTLTEQQGPGLQDQFGVAAGLVDQGQDLLGGLGQISSGLQGFQGGGFGQGQAGVDALSGLASGSNPSLQALQRQAFGQNPNLQRQIDLLGQDITRQFERGISATNLEAVGGGQLGGGRQGVAQGLLGESATQAFAQGATDLRSADIERQLQAAQAGATIQGQAGGQLAGVGLQQGQGGSQQQLQALLGAGQIGLGGLGSLQGVQNLGFEPFNQQLNPALANASILGAPTVLSKGQATAKGSAFDVAGGIGPLPA